MAAPTMNWVRIYSDILTDPKMEDMTDTVKWRWVQLIVLAGECDEEGLLIDDGEALTVEYMARRFGVKPSKLSHDLDELMSKKLVTRLESVYFIPKFSERQGRKRSELREINRVRKERQRENTAKLENVTRDNALPVPPTDKIRGEKKREEEDKTSDAKAPAPRPANLLFDAIAQVTASNAKLMGSRIGKCASQLSKIGATPEQVIQVAKWYCANDWRGRKGERLTLALLVEVWEMGVGNTQMPPPRSSGNGNGQNEPAGFAAIREAILDPKWSEK